MDIITNWHRAALKTQRIFGAGILIMALLITHGASATVISDNYQGSDDHSWGDIIGAPGTFDITHADVIRNGDTYVIDLYTNFAGRAADGLFAGYTVGGTGIGYGDLFLSRTWKPFGSAPYANDNHANGTDWEYGVVLDDRWSATGGKLSLYALTGANTDHILLAEDFLTCATYRNGQEVAVDQSNSSSATKLPNNTGDAWSVHTDGIYDGNDFVRLQFDISGTTLANSDELSLHWGLTCANDVIEGRAVVRGPSGGSIPEPGTVGLLMLGCYALFARRQRR